MGLPTVWDLLSPAEEKDVKISTLRGKTIAVDISAWILELRSNSYAQQYSSVYIKNLFYRLLEFMREGVRLVIVIDGKAPALKQAAMQRRQQAQFGSASGTFNPDRPMLAKSVQKCVEMFESLGLPCIYAEGEGEATCAHLDATQAVDGCLSQDSDFFCYGGKTLYRNLDKKNKVYEVNKVSDLERKAGLGRRDLVALALLLGCDYSRKGVESVGKERARELINHLKAQNIDVLDRIVGWRENLELSNIEKELSVMIKSQSHCSKCDHLGRVSVHKESGCSVCQTDKGCTKSCDSKCPCDWHVQKRLQNEHKLEIGIRSKSLQNPDFPDLQIIDEYLRPRGDHSVQFGAVAVPRLMKFLQSAFRWGTSKIQAKVVPCYILQQIWQPQLYTPKMYTPIRINKSCSVKLVECYEVSWDKTDKNSWADEAHSTSVLVKVEKSLFEQTYPAVVRNYEERIKAEQQAMGAGKKRKRKNAGSDPSQRKLNFTKVKRKLDYKTVAAIADAEQDNPTKPADILSCANGKPENSDTARANPESADKQLSAASGKPENREAARTRSRKDGGDRAENGDLDFIVIEGDDDDETEHVNPQTEGLKGKEASTSSSLKQSRSQSRVETVPISKSSTGMFKPVNKNIPRGTKRVNKSGKKQKLSGQSTLKDFFKSRLR